MLSPDEIALRLNLSRRSVYRLIDRGELPATRLGSTRNAPLRVPEAALDAWLWATPNPERN